jgi:hypothetical protein
MHKTSFRISIFIPFLLASAFLRAQNTSTQNPPTEKPPTCVEERQAQNAATPGRFVKRTFGPASLIMAGAGAGVTQGTDTPAEWGQGAVGYGRRFASSFGKHIVSNIIRYPVAHFRHEELVYHPSGKHGFGPRVKYAMLSTFITHKTTTGASTVYTAELSGAVGSGLISRLWQPASTHTIAAGFSSAGTSLAVDMGIHVLREFWPEIRHPHRKNAPAGATAQAEPAAPTPGAEEISTGEEATAKAAPCGP